MLPLWIFSEGDQRRGLGHLSRCYAYAAAWRQQGGAVHWVVDGDETAQRFLQGETVTWLGWQHHPELFVPTNGFAIVDSYSAPLFLLQKIAASFIRVVYMDDTYRLPYPKGYVIHSSPDKEDYIDGQAEWLIGLQWHPLRPGFWDVPKPREVADKIENILIIMGATDVYHMTPSIIRLVRLVYPYTKIHVISNNSNLNRYENCTIHSNLNDKQMAKLMCMCDLAISAAGQTTYELATCGLPAILICLIDNQANQFTWWKENDIFPEGVWRNEDTLEEKLIAALKKMAAPDYRASRSEAAQKIMSSQGITNLIQLLVADK